MDTAATAISDRTATEALAPGPMPTSGALTPELAARRVRQRRYMLLVQVVSYSLGASILLLYAYLGTVSMAVPSLFWVSGLTLIGIFAILSESGFNNRFEDHYLTVAQISSHLALQLAFLVAVPTIGFTFISVLFLIFAFGALRMTARQATITWTVASISLAPVFLLSDLPIGLPVASHLERFAAMLCIVLTIGQCTFLGLFGSTLRKTLYRRTIELRIAHQRIMELAELDELTGSFNRRTILRLLDEEIARARRVNEPCSVALIDLDWFKRINDEFGHPTGDEVLRTFATSVFANIRDRDRFGRYGGEEFLLVLPGSPHDNARQMLERLQAIVAELDWSAFSHEMRVTISAGVATLRGGDNIDSILARADAALYEAKAQGRNRVV